jgi:putative flippase GtrA
METNMNAPIDEAHAPAPKLYVVARAKPPGRGRLPAPLAALASALGERLISPFLSRRFVKFATVGLSGVLVNLGVLALLRRLHLHTNLASALAIEASILSNFAVNHLWTFGDRRGDGPWSLLGRGLRFHLVSLGGGAIQFLIFVAMNVAWLHLFASATEASAYDAGARSTAERWLWHPLVEPPNVGGLVYVSQIAGIGAATAWNYLLNFYWTWAGQRTHARLSVTLGRSA